MNIDRIAIIGGTGPQGRGLATRLAMVGCTVVIGSRDRTRAENVADAVRKAAGSERVSGADNLAAVSTDVQAVIVAIPVEGLRPTLLELRGRLIEKIVVDVVVPLEKREGLVEHVPPMDAPSAGEYLKILLPESHVVGAFKNVPAAHLAHFHVPLEGDVLVCGDDLDARGSVAALAERIPSLRAVDAGPLRMARPIEAITAVLVNLNRWHRAHTSIKILGLEGR